MKAILGVDTSNYTTSLALIDCESLEIIARCQRLLPVKEGERGIRQSDAIFHHTAALPELWEALYRDFSGEIVGVAVSDKPSERIGSYMPCFLAGVSAAVSAASALQVPLFRTTHQAGHVLACLYGSGQLDAIKKPLLCFHVSGGTTDAVLVSPDQSQLLRIEMVAKSMDLKAGQAVDRIGVKMGYAFPAGKAMDALALLSDQRYTQKAAMIGSNCSLSGLENQALKLLEESNNREDTARFVFDYLANTLKTMGLELQKKYGQLPLYFAGGVMSNSIIRERLKDEIGGIFCPPSFSADNAMGTAVYGYLKWKNLKD